MNTTGRPTTAIALPTGIATGKLTESKSAIKAMDEPAIRLPGRTRP